MKTQSAKQFKKNSGYNQMKIHTLPGLHLKLPKVSMRIDS